MVAQQRTTYLRKLKICKYLWYSWKLFLYLKITNYFLTTFCTGSKAWELEDVAGETEQGVEVEADRAGDFPTCQGQGHHRRARVQDRKPRRAACRRGRVSFDTFVPTFGYLAFTDMKHSQKVYSVSCFLKKLIWFESPWISHGYFLYIILFTFVFENQSLLKIIFWLLRNCVCLTGFDLNTN